MRKHETNGNPGTFFQNSDPVDFQITKVIKLMESLRNLLMKGMRRPVD
jgi:hypothetical protein